MQRTAIVTGASRGIGKAISIALANKGFNLVLVYNKSENEAQQLASALDKEKTLLIKADVSKAEECEKVVKLAKEKFGFIDTLINNAGISHIKMFDVESQEDYDSVMNTNFRSVFTFCNLLSKDMINAKFGRIVNVSSVWGKKGASCEVLYSASKSAIIGFTQALNAELAPSNVLVNAVCPGVIDTDMNKCFSKDDRKLIEDEIPLGRFGKPEEVADVVEFLTREQLYVGGEAISITAGY